MAKTTSKKRSSTKRKKTGGNVVRFGTRTYKRIQAKKASFVEALIETLGVITEACRVSGIDRRTVYNWIRDDPEFKAAVDDVQDVALDFAEQSLHEQIRQHIPASTIFYLKTKGQRRGYVEKQKVEHSGGVEVSTVAHMSDDQLREIVKAGRALQK